MIVCLKVWVLKKRVALSANYPFATIEPNTGVVAVPDERLLKLAILVAKEEGIIPQEILKHLSEDDVPLGEVQDDTPGVEAQAVTRNFKLLDMDL